MYLSKLKFTHLGPLANAEISPSFSEEGKPLPLLLVGQNGSGKSLALSVCVDALTEARRQSFRDLPEVDREMYLKLSSKTYITSGQVYLHAHAKFESDLGLLEFDEVVASDPAQVAASQELKTIVKKTTDFPQSGFHKSAKITEGGKNEVRRKLYLYYPSFRFDLPSWLNPEANLEIRSADKTYGRAAYNFVRQNIVETSKTWIINTVLDQRLAELRLGNIPGANPLIPGANTLQIFAGYHGPNTTSLNLVNEIVKTMISSRLGQVESVRFVISTGSNRRIGIQYNKGGVEHVYAHDISQLSSGELMILGIFVDILNAHTAQNNVVPNSFEEIYGVVLIDEIDMHMHIDFQKDVLPNLITRFPNIQFIATTHSPIFVSALSDLSSPLIIELPEATPILAQDFSELREAYSFFIERNKDFRDVLDKISTQIDKEAIPLIVTEGKTDWMHLEKAIEETAPELSDKIELYKFDFDMGDINLLKIYHSYKMIPPERKVIFLFDRDNAKISGELDVLEGCSGNIAVMRILPPPFRNEGDLISIEHLYPDEVLMETEPGTEARLRFESEIVKDFNGNLFVNPNSEISIFKIFSGRSDKLQFLDRRTEGPIALSKKAFFERIISKSASKIDFSGFEPTIARIKELI